MLSRWNPPGVNPTVGLHPYLVGSTLGVNPPEKGVNPPVGLHLLPGGFHLGIFNITFVDCIMTQWAKMNVSNAFLNTSNAF